MTNEVLDILADYLTANLNDHIRALELAPGDTAPPFVNGVYARHRDHAWSKGEVPQSDGPVLLLRVDSPYTIDQQAQTVMNLSQDVEVLFAWVTRDAEPEGAELDAGYVLRALYRCLHKFMYDEPDSVQTRRGVQIRAQYNYRASPTDMQLKGGAIRAAALVTYEVIENDPGRAPVPPDEL